MQSQELASLESRLLDPLPIPIIGQCLQKKAVTALAEDRSPEAVKLLAKAVARLKEPEIKTSILDALGKLRNQNCIDAVCEVWADTRHRDLANLLVKKSWVASEPVELKIITALKVGQPQVIINGDEKIVEPLLNAFKDKDSEIANRASVYAVSLKHQHTIDYICQKWFETRDNVLEQLLSRAKYVAQSPYTLKITTCLKVGELGFIEGGDEYTCGILLEALWNEKDTEIVNRAEECLSSLTNPSAIDCFCKNWLEYRDEEVEQILCHQRYIAQNPINLKVLTALKVNRLDVIQGHDQEVVQPLLEALNDADSDILNRAREYIFSLTESEIIDYLCDLSIKQDHQIAYNILREAKHAPREISQRALSIVLFSDRTVGKI